MKKAIFFLVYLVIGISVFAQQIQNVKGVQAGDNVLITYDLLDAASRSYFIRLLYSKDGGITYSDDLKQVTGDVKENVVAGTNKKIIWDARQELGSFIGEAVFKVEALTKSATMPPPIQNKCLKVELVDIKKINSRLQIDFSVTPINGNSTIYLSAYSTNTYLQDTFNNKLKITDGFIAGTPKGQDKAALNGIPLNSYVTFDGVDPNLSVIPKLTLFIGALGSAAGACGTADAQASFTFTNVSVAK